MLSHGRRIELELWLRKLCRRDFRKRSLILHRNREALGLPPAKLLPLLLGPPTRARRPPDLDIVLIHDYVDAPIAEHSLRWLGIDDYTVLKPPVGTEWKNLWKLLLLDRYLSSDAARSAYVLYLDSSDAVLLGSPQRAIDILEKSGADLVYANTRSAKDRFLIPDVIDRMDRIARDEGFGDTPGRYVNTGTFVARTSYLRSSTRELASQIDIDAIGRYRSVNELIADRRAGRAIDPEEALVRIANDQVRARVQFVAEYPRMKIDYRSELAVSRSRFGWRRAARETRYRSPVPGHTDRRRAS
jgi:hypothetical protein